MSPKKHATYFDLETLERNFIKTSEAKDLVKVKGLAQPRSGAWTQPKSRVQPVRNWPPLK